MHLQYHTDSTLARDRPGGPWQRARGVNPKPSDPNTVECQRDMMQQVWSSSVVHLCTEMVFGCCGAALTSGAGLFRFSAKTRDSCLYRDPEARHFSWSPNRSSSGSIKCMLSFNCILFMNLKTLIKDTVMDHILIFSDLVWAEQIFDSRISWVLSLSHQQAPSVTDYNWDGFKMKRKSIWSVVLQNYDGSCKCFDLIRTLKVSNTRADDRTQ